MKTITILSSFLVVALPAAAESNRPEPHGAEDRHSDAYSVYVPEPMIFDLVRPLGARKGETEVNVLGVGPIGRRDVIRWGPEIEQAVVDGVGLEFEIPFVDDRLEALKFAGQATLGMAPASGFIHGVQAILEWFRTPDVWELSLLYIPGFQIDRVWSAIALVGLRLPLESGGETFLLVNLTPFADVGPGTTLGLEMNLDSNLEGASLVLLVPQVHQEIGKRTMIQAGGGVEWVSGEPGGALAARAIYAF